MKLGAWLKSVNKSRAEFAREINKPGATVRRWVLETRCPRKPEKELIRNATGGAVAGPDWPDYVPPGADGNHMEAA